MRLAWLLEKVTRFFFDMSILLRRNLTYLTSTFWKRAIAPPLPKPETEILLSDRNNTDYLIINMEGTLENVQQSTTEEITVADVGDDMSTLLKRGFCSTASTSSDSPFPHPRHPKRPKLTFDERKEKRLRAKEKRQAKNKMGEMGIETMDNAGRHSSGHDGFRPNYFVAFRVSNSEIWENIQKLQERILNRSVTSLVTCKSGQIFKETLIPVQKLHFTLHVMDLQTAGHISTVTEVLKSLVHRVQENFIRDPLHIPITGIGHFRNSVLFAKIHGDQHIREVEKLSILIKQELECAGFKGDSKSFKPHMTIAKMSKAKKLYKKKVRSFPIELWRDDEHTHFGHQRVEGVELLSMVETDPITKYYKCVAQFKFQENSPSPAIAHGNPSTTKPPE